MSTGSTQMGKTLDKNILVISDLHLGEDLRPGGANVSYLRHLATLERELETFLAHYTSHRLDGRPWRLVVNGDMVDFMSVMILPEEARQHDDDEEDRLYGLGFGERESQKKMERVIARHQGVFKQLGEFVAAGNELVIVVGNHDVEFHYPQVQRRWSSGCAGLALGIGADDAARDAFARRIEFCPWFYYQEDLHLHRARAPVRRVLLVRLSAAPGRARAARSTRRAASPCRWRTPACATSPTRSPTTTRTRPSTGASSTT